MSLNDDWYQHTIPSGVSLRYREDDEPTPFIFRLHVEDEKYFDRTHEIIPLKQPRNSHYVYVKMKFGVEGTRNEYGDGQAWYYPEDRIIVLWELLINRNVGVKGTELALWKAFERVLWEQFPEATGMAITRHDPSANMLWVRDQLGFTEPPDELLIYHGPLDMQAHCFYKPRPEASHDDTR